MKDLKKYAFANTTIKVDEAKGTSWGDVPDEIKVTDKKVVDDKGKAVAAQNNIKKGKGKETQSRNNGWKVRMPDPDKVAQGKVGVKDMGNNERALFASFQAKEDFFCQGAAGWAKSSLIYQMCDVFNLCCITVNLDKIEAVELGGIPTPIRDEKTGHVVQEIALPPWTKFMLDNPNLQFLLFFDEMNQAPGDVQNALMPIVNDHTICGIEFENYFVGAAGNLQNENDFLTELSKPLKARFNVIAWESHTPSEWKKSFDFLHKKWDPILGKELVGRFEELAMDCFDSPRDIEKKAFKFIKNTLDAPTFDKDDTFDSSDVLKRFDRFVPEGLQGVKERSRSAYDNLVRLAEFVSQFLQAGGLEGWEAKKNAGTTSRSARGKQTSFGLEPADIDFLERAIKTGQYTNANETDEKHPRGKKYGVTRENFRDLMDAEVMNAEQFARFLKMMEDKGVKFKYEKNSDLPANLPPIPYDPETRKAAGE